jgi:hypothetical protein
MIQKCLPSLTRGTCLILEDGQPCVHERAGRKRNRTPSALRLSIRPPIVIAEHRVNAVRGFRSGKRSRLIGAGYFARDKTMTGLKFA